MKRAIKAADMNYKEIYTNILEEQGWSVIADDDDYVEIESWTDNGVDVVLDIWCEPDWSDFAEKVFEYFNDYAAYDEAAELLSGMAPFDATTMNMVITGCEQQEDMLDELWQALRNA